jgi:Kef-type K+ transport system membrane component KefB
MEQIWTVAALWIGMALLATLISIRLGISVALIEICLGVAGGNLLDMHATVWINFLASAGSVLLTFLAGAEIDLAVLRIKWKETLTIGLFSFFAPFLGAMA